MMKSENFKEGFKRRVKDNKPTRWVRFGLVALIYLLWVAWLGNWWFLLGEILLFDIYITGYIPFSWWRRSERPWVRSVMSWVDAIVYALVLVYFIFAFLGQNYMIPSSSLEKTLLTGDYLVVNKAVYGPRVPITPINMPLVHNKLPILNCDSYLPWPENGYRRLKGLRSVELGDIVVFNFPAGDTVVTNLEEQANYYDLLKQFPKEYIKANPQIFGQIKYRPVDRRTNYVKRTVGLPGDIFKIKNDTIYINGKPQPYPKNVQFRYVIQAKPITDEMQKKYGISNEDMETSGLAPTNVEYMKQLLGFSDAGYNIINLPLTRGTLEEMTRDGVIAKSVKFNDYFVSGALFDDPVRSAWTTSNWGDADGVWIPKKGESIVLTPENWTIYNRAIRNYEGHHDYQLCADGIVRDGNGNEVSAYTFGMDYYFMMGDNRDNSLDSRFWGFVPEDHIVGTPLIVVASFDKDRSIFNGGMRFNRMFTIPNPDKDAFKAH